ncbi:MAG: murein L,D-transpeptidase catalytic domain family protein [Caulobacteraceae bacterium]|nr:murein L,D-transpeptidase catalytic domain family protein [Caulobacteraceae bacterium]
MSSRTRPGLPTIAACGRRSFLQISLASLALSTLGGRAFAMADHPAVPIAKAGLQSMGCKVAHADVVGVADFAQPSRVPRLHLVDLAGGEVATLLVAHGRGSDPEHTGWLQNFSNRPGSGATSQGHYLTGADYLGAHGRSMRLKGLDASNNNAEARGIVVHSAWYVGSDTVRERGMLGRSEGCFAVSQGDLAQVLDRLGPGRLLIATKL